MHIVQRTEVGKYLVCQWVGLGASGMNRTTHPQPTRVKSSTASSRHISSLPCSTAVLFMAAFFKILNQEWHSIDRLRLDKFYLVRFCTPSSHTVWYMQLLFSWQLIRKVVSHSFQLLRANQWNKGSAQSH